jgi:hypothetical protein
MTLQEELTEAREHVHYLDGELDTLRKALSPYWQKREQFTQLIQQSHNTVISYEKVCFHSFVGERMTVTSDVWVGPSGPTYRRPADVRGHVEPRQKAIVKLDAERSEYRRAAFTQWTDMCEPHLPNLRRWRKLNAEMNFARKELNRVFKLMEKER